MAAPDTIAMPATAAGSVLTDADVEWVARIGQALVWTTRTTAPTQFTVPPPDDEHSVLTATERAWILDAAKAVMAGIDTADTIGHPVDVTLPATPPDTRLAAEDMQWLADAIRVVRNTFTTRPAPAAKRTEIIRDPDGRSVSPSSPLVGGHRPRRVSDQGDGEIEPPSSPANACPSSAT